MLVGTHSALHLPHSPEGQGSPGQPRKNWVQGGQSVPEAQGSSVLSQDLSTAQTRLQAWSLLAVLHCCLRLFKNTVSVTQPASWGPCLQTAVRHWPERPYLEARDRGTACSMVSKAACWDREAAGHFPIALGRGEPSSVSRGMDQCLQFRCIPFRLALLRELPKSSGFLSPASWRP